MVLMLIKLCDVIIFENKIFVLSIKRYLLNEKLKISEILFLKKVYLMIIKLDQIVFYFQCMIFYKKFFFGFILKKINFIILFIMIKFLIILKMIDLVLVCKMN